MLVRTEGFVLRSVPYKETTRLVTLYTRELGKLTVIAHGAQSVKNRFGSTLQPLAHVQAVLYTRPTRSIQVLSDCSHVNIYSKISKDLGKLATGQHICGLVLSLTEEGQRSVEIFHLLVSMINALDTLDADAELIKMYFQLHFIDLLGFAPAFSQESLGEIDTSGGFLLLEDGTITNEEVDNQSTAYASRSVLRAFATLCRADFEAAMRLQLTAKQRNNLSILITRFIQYHIPGTYPVRGGKVVDQLLDAKKK
ncbi:MAG: DNA repair protein RecO [Bacteroidetes bacterium]|nr:DNA repair protein RecO [Bacteroidota bacterium]MCY4205866.1 DNA repair protein RecO [Bacteroidota bacterium]